MIHSVPELRVTQEQAEKLGKADVDRLLKLRKLVLLVDLDQTLIHSTNENAQGIEGIHTYHLYGPGTLIYHTKFRPHTLEFLKEISKLYELHICTFGARMYAHKIAELLDPTKEYFYHRILSRDECFDPTSKTGNLKALFPCGDSLVCIIDDREDVWKDAPNLVSVKPYYFFKNTGDINSPFKRKEPSMFQNPYTAPPTDDQVSSTSSSSKPVSGDNDQQDKVNDSPLDLSKDTNNDTSREEVLSENNYPDSSISQADKDDNLLENVKDTKDMKDMKESLKHEDGRGQDPDQKEDEEERKEEDKNIEDKKDKKVHVQEEDEKSEKSEDKEEEEEDKQESKQLEQVECCQPKIEDIDDYLLYLGDILTRIHNEYFSRYDELVKYTTSEEEYVSLPDLKKIIPEVKKRTLKGVNIVFSGVIPTNMQMKDAKLYQLATTFGARVSKDINLDGSPLERTTHLVAAKPGTAKVIKALKCGKIFVVNPLWLFCCAERWERVDENLFILSNDDDFSDVQERKLKTSTAETSNPPSNTSTQKNKQPESLCPVYDPVTGKKVNPLTKKQDKPGILKDDTDNQASSSKGPLNMLQFSPLSGFSKSDLLLMDKEVDDACSEGDEMSTGNTDSEEENVQSAPLQKRKMDYTYQEEEESNNSEFPTGWSDNKNKKKCKYAYTRLEDEDTRDSYQEQSDSNSDDDDYNESIGSADEEMAAAVEREFLS